MSCEIQTHATEPTTRTRTLRCSPVVTIALCLSIMGSGCLGGSWTNAESRHPNDAADRATQIETLKASIERDHRTLENLITQPGLAADRSLHENPELRAIAERLTALEQALEQLESSPISEAESSDPSE